jgi:hypothetical protein
MGSDKTTLVSGISSFLIGADHRKRRPFLAAPFSFIASFHLLALPWLASCSRSTMNGPASALAADADASEHTKRSIATALVARVRSVSPGNRTNWLPTASVDHLCHDRTDGRAEHRADATRRVTADFADAARQPSIKNRNSGITRVSLPGSE